MRVFENSLKACIQAPLHQYEFDAYVELSHNIGPGAFCRSTIVKRLNVGDYPGACVRQSCCSSALATKTARHPGTGYALGCGKTGSASMPSARGSDGDDPAKQSVAVPGWRPGDSSIGLWRGGALPVRSFRWGRGGAQDLAGEVE
ncbi:lysozyme [Aeromonas salmonicida]|uniref:lysozyme n=1 Tax=Aeromonas salmonicida TaxID=645 RepID=UPI003BF4E801